MEWCAKIGCDARRAEKTMANHATSLVFIAFPPHLTDVFRRYFVACKSKPMAGRINFRSRPSIEARRSPPSRALTRATSVRYPEAISAPDFPAGPDRPETETRRAQCSDCHPGARMW